MGDRSAEPTLDGERSRSARGGLRGERSLWHADSEELGIFIAARSNRGDALRSKVVRSVVHTGGRGRPRADRFALLALLLQLPEADQLVLLNETAAARQLGCNRATVARMLDDLEGHGCVRRVWTKGRKGVLVYLEERATRLLALDSSLST
jgi:hypothetical protein